MEAVLSNPNRGPDGRFIRSKHTDRLDASFKRIFVAGLVIGALLVYLLKGC